MRSIRFLRHIDRQQMTIFLLIHVAMNINRDTNGDKVFNDLYEKEMFS